MPENPRPDDAITRMHALVIGQVQGVGFRAYVQSNAMTLGLTGWVRNTYDGDVEVMAEGTQSSLKRLLEFLDRGPRASYVAEVKSSWETATGEYSRFSILSTGY